MLDLPAHANGMVVLQARCHPGFTETQIVNTAWNFNLINEQYGSYLRLCQQQATQPFLHDQDPYQAIAWIRQERSMWHNLLRLDPLLPRPLWPPDYLGPAAWQARRQLLGM